MAQCVNGDNRQNNAAGFGRTSGAFCIASIMAARIFDGQTPGVALGSHSEHDSAQARRAAKAGAKARWHIAWREGNGTRGHRILF